MSVIRTDEVITDANLRETLVLDDDECFPTGDVIQTCAGEWRRDGDGWRWWQDSEFKL
jgi:hypothetical protein